MRPTKLQEMSFHQQSTLGAQDSIEHHLSYISRNLFESNNNDYEHGKKRRKTTISSTSSKVIWRPYLDTNDDIITAAEQSKENIDKNNNNIVIDDGIKRKRISLPGHSTDHSSPPKLHKFYEHHNTFTLSPSAMFRPIDYPDLERMPAVPPPSRNYTHHERFLLNNNSRLTPDLAEGGRITPETCGSRCSPSADSNFSPSSSIGSTDEVVVSPKLKKYSFERGRFSLFLFLFWQTMFGIYIFLGLELFWVYSGIYSEE